MKSGQIRKIHIQNIDISPSQDLFNKEILPLSGGEVKEVFIIDLMKVTRIKTPYDMIGRV